ncbi:MAG: hypothetical protein CL524_07630 [Aequorivita sp.]|nr:hypothetical protein [Aequorivita sp.]
MQKCEFRPGGLRSQFRLAMECSVPAERIGLAKWRAEIGDGVQDLFNEALYPKCSFSRNVEKWAEG